MKAISTAELDAIAGGYHGDPFALLGPHQTRRGKIPAFEVRAFLPQATSASVVTATGTVLMARLHADGIFSAPLESANVPYQFQYQTHTGEKITEEDPYRFPPLIEDADLHLYAEGNLNEGWKVFGAQPLAVDGIPGVRFAVWAPNAAAVSISGDFNSWDARRHPMRLRAGGVWEIFLPCARVGHAYKYFIRSKHHGYQELKSDPWAFQSEVPPRSASVVADMAHQWADAAWLEKRAATDWLKAPISIYEVHLESWMRAPGGGLLTYREMAERLVEYVRRLNFTHVELMPVEEHPYAGSWGYQVTGYFAPTSRFGSAADFKHLIGQFHEAGIGVILDWVPAHFPKDAHGLAFFDGTALYEHADPRQGEHRDWGTLIFNFGRNEVRSFLISSALFWLREYHIDGIRVDAVASMLYLDYSRKAGEWVPNVHGGRENLEAISFLRRFNELAHRESGAVTFAEESTAFPGVSRPVYAGGLGFTFKWNMGWMHDMLNYFALNPVHRRFHHGNITFSMLYAFTENFVLPVSHDEVVHGKRSLLAKMPGDEWQRFANVRAFLAYMYAHPGKKLLFMGAELGDPAEWNHATDLPWDLLQSPLHGALQFFVRDLNRFYRENPDLWLDDCSHAGFEWIDIADVDQSVICFLRRPAANAEASARPLIFACNFTPVPRELYGIGVPGPGIYDEVFNTDSTYYGGSNMGNLGGVRAISRPLHSRPYRLEVVLPPLAVVAFRERVATAPQESETAGRRPARRGRSA